MWQATRKMTTGDGTPFEVSIGIPEAPPTERHMWACPVRFVIGGVENVRQANGADAFQALQTAFEMIYAEVKPRDCTLDGFPTGYSGFFESITLDPILYDVKKISRMVAEETARQVEEVRIAQEARGRPPA